MNYGSIVSAATMPAVGGRRFIYASLLASSVLLFAAISWNFSANRVVLSQDADSIGLFGAEQAVEIAQAKVQRDMAEAAKFQQSSLFSSPLDWLHNGPQAKVKEFPPPSAVDAITLETPDEQYTKTPRLKRHNRFGPNNRYCAGGNCDNFDQAGLVSDRWPTDVYSGIPWFSTDPDASPERVRNLNQREGEFARELHPDTYHAPVQWGVGAAPEANPDGYEGQGTIAPADRGVSVLEKEGVNHDNWPFDVYSGFPWPSWDKTQFDQKKHQDLLPSADPVETIDATRQSSAALRAAGVTVDHLPFDESKREYNNVDGMMDKLVAAPKVPRWSKGGAAPQDLPSSFLLQEHPDLAAPQPAEDAELGVEVEPVTRKQRNVWDSLGCGPQGCFGGREGEEFERPDE